MREASRVRTQNGLRLSDTICPYDLALKCGLTVQFIAAPTLEGMYEAQRRAIMIGSERPAGRRRFTAGHELGHHIFNHGTSLDQLRGSHTDAATPEEFLADCFSASLIMPKTAIDAAINRRGWSRRQFSAQMIWVLAQDLGVGYETLLTHLNLVLRYLSGAATTQLEKKKPIDLRDEFAGFDVKFDAYPVDEFWGTRPVDLEVGDIVLGALSVVEGRSLELVDSWKPHLAAVRPGITKLQLPGGRPLTARVSQRDYFGRAQYRHEEDVEEDAE